jgi:hypothetical protein
MFTDYFDLVARLVSVPALGEGGRQFESDHYDLMKCNCLYLR